MTAPEPSQLRKKPLLSRLQFEFSFSAALNEKLLIFMAHLMHTSTTARSKAEKNQINKNVCLILLWCLTTVKNQLNYKLLKLQSKKKIRNHRSFSQNPVVLLVWKRAKSRRKQSKIEGVRD